MNLHADSVLEDLADIRIIAQRAIDNAQRAKSERAELLAALQMAERCLAAGPDLDPVIPFATLERIRGAIAKATRE